MMVLSSGSARFFFGDLQGCEARWLEAAELAAETDDSDLKAAVWFPTSTIFTHVGPLATGMLWNDRVLEISAGNLDRGVALTGYSAPGFALAVRAGLLARMGRLGEAGAESERALTVLRARAEPEPLCWALAVPSLLAWLSGEGRDTSASAQEAIRLAEDTGNVSSLVIGLEATAIAHLVVGQPDEAVAACERALAVGREKRSGLHLEASVVAHLAQARLAAGDRAAAEAAAAEAVEVARRQGARVDECLALLTRAHVGRLRGGSTEAVGTDLNAALTLVGEVGALTYEPFIREELGRLRADESQLREALRLYEFIGATGHARRLDAELAASPRPE
jgi:tetratricopeptide (TPR) repeat protein